MTSSVESLLQEAADAFDSISGKVLRDFERVLIAAYEPDSVAAILEIEREKMAANRADSLAKTRALLLAHDNAARAPFHSLH